jgi:two-component system, sensor histidine kinase
MRLRWSILALMGIALVPLVLVAGLVVWWAHRDERQDLEQALLDRARALAVAVDREVEISIGALEGLATSDRLDARDLSAFYEQARRAKAAYPRWLSVTLIDPSGRQLLNLLRPLGTPLPSVADFEVFQRTLRTRQPEVSPLVMGPTAPRWLIVINVPVLRDTQLRYVLSATMTPDGFAALLAAAQIPADSLGTIIDRNGIVVARSQDQDQRVGKPAAPRYVTLARQQDEGVFEGQTLNGWNAYQAFSRAPRSQLAVGIAVPAERVDAPLRRSLWTLSGAAVAAFGLSVGLAVLAGRRVTRRMTGLALALRAFGRGEAIPDLPTFWVTEFRGVAQALRDAMALLQTRTEALQKSEAELAASEGRYRRLIEESFEGIIIQQQGVVRFVNAAGARLFGYDRPVDAIGTLVATHVPQEYREEAATRNATRLRGDTGPATIRMEALRRDGSRFWIEATASVMEWEGAPATRVSCVDISERRRREAAEREAESLRSVAKLANATAHEINNPLTVIAGSLHFLRAEIRDRPKAAGYFDRVQRAVQRITEMIGHMQHITRLEPLAGLDTAGLGTLDLRRSSGPAPGSEPTDTEEGAGPTRSS